jgi:hypothetical protein
VVDLEMKMANAIRALVWIGILMVVIAVRLAMFALKVDL